MCVCVCVRMYVCMHACMHAWMDGWMDGCIYVCVHVCMYVCTHLYMTRSKYSIKPYKTYKRAIKHSHIQDLSHVYDACSEGPGGRQEIRAPVEQHEDFGPVKGSLNPKP